jgi:guanylate kinase
MITQKIAVISGPSGVGKTTLCDELVKQEPRLKLCRTATTRPPRPGESSNDYYFISRQTFMEWFKKGEIIEYIELFGNFYGTPEKSIRDISRSGGYPLLRIDVEGGRSLRRLGYKGVFIFVLPPDFSALEERLKKRVTASDDLARRLARAKEELTYQNEYDFKVINDNLARVVAEIRDILVKHLFNTNKRAVHVL